MSKTSKLVVIVGETASGKSALAMRIAQAFSGEIICADSMTVRRGVDIGSAKPSAKDQSLVPHHLLDVAEPDEEFTAARFKELANEAIGTIAERDKLPIMVGGTGLYIDGVLYDYDFLPAGDLGEREALNQLSVDELLKVIDERKLELGGVDAQNKRRLIRLIETNGARASNKILRQNTLVLGMASERQELNERIESRMDALLAAGLEQEVRELAEHYGWGCEALKGVGYAQWHDYFLGAQTLPQTRASIIGATRDLAKRQRTWFKRNKSIHWLDTPVKWHDVVDSVTTFLQ